MAQDFEFPTVGDMIASQGNYLLYGESGVGKTYALSTVKNILVLDIEKGSRSLPPDMPLCPLDRLQDAFESPRDEFPSFVIRRPSFEQISQIYDLLLSPQYEGRFDAVAIDTVTTLLDIIESWALKNHSRSVVQVTSPDSGGGKGVKTLTLQGWGMVQQKLSGLTTAFCDLPIHTIFTFHEEMGETTDGRPQIRPAIKGKRLITQLQALVDFGFRLELKQVKSKGVEKIDRAIRCLPTPGAWAKCRDWRGGLFSEYEDPDLGALLRKIEGSSRSGSENTTEITGAS